MRKYILLTTIATIVLAGIAYAADCTSVSDSVTETKCKDLGYTMTASQCSGKNMVKCPLNTNWVWCGDQSSSSTSGDQSSSSTSGDQSSSSTNTCSSDYSLTTCPEGGVCEECGGKYNITGCKSNWNYYSYGKYCCDANEYIYTTCPGNSDCTTCGSWYKWDSCYEGYEWRDDLSKCCPSGNASCD